MFLPFARRHLMPLYGDWIMRRHLDGLWVQGMDEATALLREGPVIFAANHVAWWDGIVMLTLAPRMGADNRFLVATHNVDKLGYLEAFGGIGFDRSNTATMLEGMESAAGWLDRPGRSLWVYPQGRYRPAHLRPLDLQPGVRLLHRLSGAPIVPVTLNLEWFLAHLPACAVTFGAPIAGGRDVMQRLEAAMIDQLDEIDRWFDTDEPGPPFEAHVPSAVTSIEDGTASKIMDVVLTRLRRAVGGATA